MQTWIDRIVLNEELAMRVAFAAPALQTFTRVGKKSLSRGVGNPRDKLPIASSTMPVC